MSQDPADVDAGSRAGAGPGSDPESGLRERKKERTRKLLREGAAALFAERGFAGTTVADIAACANVSERTFFRYFESKEALLLPDSLDVFGYVEAELARRPRRRIRSTRCATPSSPPWRRSPLPASPP